MKIILGAIALTLAVPATAQTAPVADPHAQHKGMDHSQHKAGEHDCKECCEKMKQQGGKMECMDKKGEAKTSSSAGQQDHQGHEGHAH
jgi:hypothetical protein